MIGSLRPQTAMARFSASQSWRDATLIAKKAVDCAVASYGGEPTKHPNRQTDSETKKMEQWCPAMSASVGQAYYTY